MSDVKQDYGYILLMPHKDSESYSAFVETQNLTRHKSDAEFRRRMYVATGQMPKDTVVARVTWETKDAL